MSKRTRWLVVLGGVFLAASLPPALPAGGAREARGEPRGLKLVGYGRLGVAREAEVPWGASPSQIESLLDDGKLVCSDQRCQLSGQTVVWKTTAGSKLAEPALFFAAGRFAAYRVRFSAGEFDRAKLALVAALGRPLFDYRSAWDNPAGGAMEQEAVGWVGESVKVDLFARDREPTASVMEVFYRPLWKGAEAVADRLP